MIKLIGFLLIVAAVLLGLWLGIWVMFIGGIAQFINGIKVTPVDALGIATGIARVLFAGAVGWVVAVIVGFFGVMLMSD